MQSYNSITVPDSLTTGVLDNVFTMNQNNLRKNICGIEFLVGSVKAKYITLIYIGIDSFDIDKIQWLYVVPSFRTGGKLKS